MEIKNEDGKREKYYLYYDGETVAGTVSTINAKLWTLIYCNLLICTHACVYQEITEHVHKWCSIFVFFNCLLESGDSRVSIGFTAVKFLETYKHFLEHLASNLKKRTEDLRLPNHEIQQLNRKQKWGWYLMALTVHFTVWR